MSQSPLSGKKRQRPPPSSSGLSRQLTTDERSIYNIIKSKGDIGICKADLKKNKESKNTPKLDLCIKNLIRYNKIREVKNIQNKRRNHLVSTEFEPSKELTGDTTWYTDGNLDKDFIEALRKACKMTIINQKVATPEVILAEVKRSRLLNVDLTIGQINAILKVLVLDNGIVEVKSNGTGEFGSIPVGAVCYRVRRGGGEYFGAMEMIPCGACPRINQCEPEGVISPKTCKYFNKWLEF